jgi:hypothetical protein
MPAVILLAPLIGPAELHGTAPILVQAVEVIGLQQHVRELGVRDAVLAIFETRAHRLFRDHVIDGEVLADVAQELQVGDILEPVIVVDDNRGARAVEAENAADGLRDAGEVVLQLLLG